MQPIKFVHVLHMHNVAAYPSHHTTHVATAFTDELCVVTKMRPKDNPYASEHTTVTALSKYF